MGVSISDAVHSHSMDRWALSGAGVKAPWDSMLETVWLHRGEAQQVGMPSRIRRLSACVRHRHPVAVHKASLMTGSIRQVWALRHLTGTHQVWRYSPTVDISWLCTPSTVCQSLPACMIARSLAYFLEMADQRCRCWEGVTGRIPVGRCSGGVVTCSVCHYQWSRVKLRLPISSMINRTMHLSGSNRIATCRYKLLWLQRLLL